MALQKTLKSAKLRPLLAQFVPIHVNTNTEEYGAFRQRFPQKGEGGGGIPIVVIIRADGEVLYDATGALNESEIGSLVARLAPELGRPLRPADADKLFEAVTSATAAHQSGDVAKALTLLAPLAKAKGSYASPVVEGETLLKTIIEQGTSEAAAAAEKLSGDDADEGLAGAVDLARLARVFKKAPAVVKLIGEAKKEHGKSPEAKKLLTYAAAIDKALATAAAGKKPKAIEQLNALKEKYKDTPVVAFVEAKVAELEK